MPMKSNFIMETSLGGGTKVLIKCFCSHDKDGLSKYCSYDDPRLMWP